MKRLRKGLLIIGLIAAFSFPIFVSSSSAVSGLAVAKYKLEGAHEQGWTNLPLNKTYQDITLTNPGTTIVTLYAEDKAGNQNYQIKSFTITEGMQDDAPVDKIEYRLSGATEQGWTIYTQPFVITNEGETKIEVRVTDKAGNVTNTSEIIRLDKTSPVNTKAVISLN